MSKLVASVVTAALMLSPPTSLPAASAVSLSWSQDFYLATSSTFTWGGATTRASNLSEGGFTDWRLPTRAEWQAAIQNGTVGPLVPNLSPGNLYWTADTKGTKAYAVSISTDASGNVIASQSGQVSLWSKGSSMYAVAVRP